MPELPFEARNGSIDDRIKARAYGDWRLDKTCAEKSIVLCEEIEWRGYAILRVRATGSR